MSNEIVLSIIIPTFNRAKLLSRAIKSVLKQNISQFELLVIDDGSTDETKIIVTEYYKKDNRIKYFYHKNQGHPKTLNKGLKLSKGNYITFLDSDDEYDENHLSPRIKFMDENREIDLIYSPAKIIGGNYFVPDARDKTKLIHLDDCIIGATFFGKQKMFLSLNGFKNIYGQDYEFYNRAKKKFKIEKYLNRTYIYHRDLQNQLTSIPEKNSTK